MCLCWCRRLSYGSLILYLIHQFLLTKKVDVYVCLCSISHRIDTLTETKHRHIERGEREDF